MNKYCLKTAGIVAMLAVLLPLHAAAARLIPFQARLVDAGGANVSDGVYSIAFSVYDAPVSGVALVTEVHTTASVIDGYVNVMLGSIVDLDGVSFNDARYLGITVGNGQEMVPRHELVPAFHARTAERSDTAALADVATRAVTAEQVQDGGLTRDALNTDLMRALVPQNTVIHYLGTTCPPGWSEYTTARGRAIVGLPVGGTLQGTNGAGPFGNQENRAHSHTLVSNVLTGTSTSNTHNHAWSYFLGGSANDWVSYSSTGSGYTISNWTNGIGGEGEGSIPLTRPQNSGTTTFYTNDDSHNHGPGSLRIANTNTVGVNGQVPFVQLLTCRKTTP